MTTDDNDDASSEGSSRLSSMPSIGRQMTELTDAGRASIVDLQCNRFQERGTEFWIRQSTVPTQTQNQETIQRLKRQMSCPNPGGLSKMTPGGLSKIRDHDESSEGSGTGLGSRQVTQDELQESDGGLLESALSSVISESNFCVLAADPESLDTDLIAVSDGFVKLTGYPREEVVGTNCRFLNEGCDMPLEQRQRLSKAVETGAAFTEVVNNRKESGKPFQNLLDLRGLVIARNEGTGEDIWVLVAVLMDVTGMAKENIPASHFAVLKQLVSRIRKRLLKQLGELGLGGSLVSSKRFPQGVGGSSYGDMSWNFTSEDCDVWRPGTTSPAAPVADIRNKSIKRNAEPIEHTGGGTKESSGLFTVWFTSGILTVAAVLLVVRLVRKPSAVQ